MNQLLFIDNEKAVNMPYMRTLGENQCEVTYCRSVIEAISILESTADVDLIILDVMMPTPHGVPKSDTGRGNDTGLWFLGTIQETIQSRGIPVLLLTNRIKSEIEEYVTNLKIYPSSLVEVALKADTSRQMLPLLVQKLLKLWPPRRK